jgi:hypothetical protein
LVPKLLDESADIRSQCRADTNNLDDIDTPHSIFETYVAVIAKIA